MRTYPLVSPWQSWEGDGYWPEMYTGVRNESYVGKSGQGKKKSNGELRGEWISREDVRLGMDDVGKWKIDELEILDEKEAERFLPSPKDKEGNPWIRCHVGLYPNQHPVDFKRFDTKLIHDYSPVSQGFIFSAGGPIWGLDWCPYPERLSATLDFTQYLAVSTLPRHDSNPTVGQKCSPDSPGCIQIWSMIAPDDVPSLQHSSEDHEMEDDSRTFGKEKGEMRCELVLCVDGGSAMDLRWMPLGVWDEYEPSNTSDKIPKLGIIAALQLDGSVSFYPVPQPHALRRALQTSQGGELISVRMKEPLLRIEVEDASCLCMDWLSGSRLVVGLSNGHIAIYDLTPSSFSSPSTEVFPSAYIPITCSPIRSVAALRLPPDDSHGKPRWGQDPFFVLCGNYDGTTTIVDLRDPSRAVELSRARAPSMSVAWSAPLGSPLLVDVEHMLILSKIRGYGTGKNHYVAPHRGLVWHIATSDYHPMVLTAGTDGSTILSNYKAGYHRARGEGLNSQRIFEIDYDEYTEEYRMVDNIAPEVISVEASFGRTAKNARPTFDPRVSKTVHWSPRVGVHRVRWNDSNGLKNAGWFVSGTASGLGRVECLKGRFVNGRVPQGLGFAE
ncbi:hypothetical protein TREMEDRAFT_27087 [Tremella mesenterica DSM 1558]|uniref:uncharacterized protein n=1 Tax=Tremella mesenterica (strain ATCC 24925 / CBS 8224 / DSM 1558 / NBRC 9311 / NRRL Y-6157 / RJB 2259-6 / UBC 559-6) TaxID=578456 RepID=UPI0003F4A4AD|nr:uncharacterized protein TREMEDRAFT_27087 [Tremella mesenterica DSM 1558]EIW71800.1 hypothetical protein TREMEDRAFT_27087 [Tremella mesenterica DSM 1558]